MEIITYVREGAITHQDSLGNQGRTEAGDVQVMSAGTGIRHAEYNLEPETTRSSRSGSSPTTAAASRPGARKPFPKATAPASFVTLASGLTADTDALPIRADARVLGATLKAGESAEYALGTDAPRLSRPGRGRGRGQRRALDARDGAAISDEATLKITALEDAEWCWSTRRKPSPTQRRRCAASPPRVLLSNVETNKWQKFLFSIIPPTGISRPWPRLSPMVPARPAPPSMSSACPNSCLQRRQGLALQARPGRAGREDRRPRQL